MNPIGAPFQPAKEAILPKPSTPDLSVVIPVHNEAENLRELTERLTRVLEVTEQSYEILFIDDGSQDGSLQILLDLHRNDDRIVVLELTRNFGQHPAVFAGFKHARGQIIITLDADLQNPPEAIPLLLQKIEEGYDVVGGWRENRRDSPFRLLASRGINGLISRSTQVKMHDYGCMLRVYRREIVEQIRQCNEISSFIPALANTFARQATEVRVPHEARRAGVTKYKISQLLRLNFDLLTGFSILPIQIISWAGAAITLCGLLSSLGLLFWTTFLKNPQNIPSLFRFSTLCFFNGLEILALGLIGEYAARIYNEVRKRPRYVVRQIHHHVRIAP